MKRASITRIVLGTRGSELARAQTRAVADGLRKRWTDLIVETKIIRTSGDEAKKPRNLPSGRKGLFTAEIERAPVKGAVNIAVHSAKDLPSKLARRTENAAVPPRAAGADGFVANT